MKIIFDPNIPIYQQIMDFIKNKIASSLYQPGEKIKSVRELAMEFSVNPNTVQKALQELEREGYLKSERTIGRYVTSNLQLINELKESIPKAIMKKFVEDMEKAGTSKQDIVLKLENYLEVHCNE